MKQNFNGKTGLRLKKKTISSMDARQMGRRMGGNPTNGNSCDGAYTCHQCHTAFSCRRCISF